MGRTEPGQRNFAYLIAMPLGRLRRQPATAVGLDTCGTCCRSCWTDEHLSQAARSDRHAIICSDCIGLKLHPEHPIRRPKFVQLDSRTARIDIDSVPQREHLMIRIGEVSTLVTGLAACLTNIFFIQRKAGRFDEMIPTGGSR